MIIYGVALLAACFLIGQGLGYLLGDLIGVDSNVGGVGFAMALLIMIGDFARRKGLLPEISERGILFWSAMYIPVIVAMAASTNVTKALEGGWVALLAGVVGTMACLALVPVLSRLAKADNSPKSSRR